MAVGPKSNDKCPYQRDAGKTQKIESTWRQRQRCSDVATSQKMPTVTMGWKTQGRNLPWRPWRQHGPATDSTSDFEPLELWKKHVSIVLSYPVEKEEHSELGNRTLRGNMTAASETNRARFLLVLHLLLRLYLPSFFIWLSPIFPSKFYSNATSSDKPSTPKPGLDVLPCASVTNCNCLPHLILATL